MDGPVPHIMSEYGESERIVEHVKIPFDLFSVVTVHVILEKEICWGHHVHDDQVVDGRLQTEMHSPSQDTSRFFGGLKTSSENIRWQNQGLYDSLHFKLKGRG